jgi:hypothetical protein
MRRIGIIGVLSMLLVAFAASVALAQGEHFTRNGFPSCTISGTTSSGERIVTCTGELAGLGNEDLIVTTSATGEVTFLCGAPGSGNLAPGQNKVPATVTAEEPTVTPGSAIKNGRAIATDFVILTAPTDVTAEEAGCQNPNWQVVSSGLTVTSVTYTVSQGGVTLATCTRTGTNLDDFTFTRNQCSGPAV